MKERFRKVKILFLLPDIPVIYISANNDVKALSETAGAEGFIAKQFPYLVIPLCIYNIDLLRKLIGVQIPDCTPASVIIPANS
jgi:hypothetical protein